MRRSFSAFYGILWSVYVSALGCTAFNDATTDGPIPPAQGGASGAGGSGGAIDSGGNTQSGATGGVGGNPSGGNGGFGGTQEGKLCSFPGACDDGNPCTVDTCVDKKCKHTPAPSGISCSDGNKCNGIKTCDGQGTCASGEPLVIDDGNPCTIDLCDPATGTVSHKGKDDCSCDTDADCDDKNECTIDACKDDGSGKKTCSFTNQEAGTACDDKNLCTTGDQCDNGGKCQGALINVDDGNPCTVDSCEPVTGTPTHQVSMGQVCNDSDSCTTSDQCNALGKCEGVPVAVDDNDKCTVDICDPITGNIDHKGIAGCKPCTTDTDCNDGNSCTTDTCKNANCFYTDVPQGGACDDGNLCTTGDQCDVSGKCTGAPKSVDDGNPCTTDSCDPATGNPVNNPAPGQSCSDGNACTVNDNCNGSGVCTGTVKSVDDGNECTTDSCDPVTGNDSHTPLPNCKSCNSNGDCNDNNPCTVDSCSSGKCSYSNASSGTACNDGNNCTENDKCDGSSVCKGMLKNVDDGNPCTTDFCDSATGNAVHTPSSGASCNDGNECTLGDQCNQGNCVGTPKSVDDANECTTDSCDPATGNVGHVPLPNCKPCNSISDCNDNNSCTVDSCNSGKCSYTNADSSTSCDDGNKCTVKDKCDGNGSCKGGPAIVCNFPPNTECYQAGTCDSATGNCFYPIKSAGTSCNDWNACTNNDICDSSGQCSGDFEPGCQPCSQDLDCNDYMDCTDDYCTSGKCDHLYISNCQ